MGKRRSERAGSRAEAVEVTPVVLGREPGQYFARCSQAVRLLAVEARGLSGQGSGLSPSRLACGRLVAQKARSFSRGKGKVRISTRQDPVRGECGCGRARIPASASAPSLRLAWLEPTRWCRTRVTHGATGQRPSSAVNAAPEKDP
jgi:hypothetical protein